MLVSKQQQIIIPKKSERRGFWGKQKFCLSKFLVFVYLFRGWKLNFFSLVEKKPGGHFKYDEGRLKVRHQKRRAIVFFYVKLNIFFLLQFLGKWILNFLFVGDLKKNGSFRCWYCDQMCLLNSGVFKGVDF